MRFWSFDPKYLTGKLLGDVWLNGQIGRNRLIEKEGRYYNHSQLRRFRECDMPLATLDQYLYYVYEESLKRGYHYNRSLISPERNFCHLRVKRGQVRWEMIHLLNKLYNKGYEEKADEIKGLLKANAILELNPIFILVDDERRESWEKGPVYIDYYS